MPRPIKCLVIGDGGVGKSCLISTYATNEFPGEDVPMVLDLDITMNVEVGGQTYALNMWDTGGQPEYDRIRPLSYPGTDVLVICFAISNPSSYESVIEKWYSEVHHHVRDVPRLLVGTKLDLRTDKETVATLEAQGLGPVSETQGAARAKEIKAVNYLECSALTREGLKEVFEEAIRATLAPRPAPKRRPCEML